MRERNVLGKNGRRNDQEVIKRMCVDGGGRKQKTRQDKEMSEGERIVSQCEEESAGEKDVCDGRGNNDCQGSRGSGTCMEVNICCENGDRVFAA